MNQLIKPAMSAISHIPIGLLVAASSFAHAILVQSAPKANEMAAQPLVIQLTFNSRIDSQRSQVVLISPGRERTKVPLDANTSGKELKGTAEHLNPGQYRLEWQVLAIDGHITRGVIPFTVQ